jgi:hypothetical protein
MKIQNVNGFSAEQLQREAEKGARFVHYAYSISLIVTTINRETGVYMVRATESPVKQSLPFTILTVLFGWWAIPFGPKHALASIRTNLKGGKDVTDEVTAIIEGHIMFREAQQRKKLQMHG